MRVEYINHFLEAGIHVITELIGGEVELGQIAVRTAIYTTQQVSIVVELSGQLQGQLVYGMSQVTATKITSAITGTQHVSFDSFSLSAISELGNIIAGNAVTLLAQSGLNCNFTPPAVIRGLNIEVANASPALVIPLYTRVWKNRGQRRIGDGNGYPGLRIIAARNQRQYL